MKRLIALLLCATMLIAFVACDEKNAPASSETETETRETSAEKKTEEKKTEEKKTEEETETEEKETAEIPVTTTKAQGSETPSTTTKAQGGSGNTAPDPTRPTTTTKSPTTTTKRTPTTTTVAVTTRKPPVTTTAKQVVTHFKNENPEGRYEPNSVSAVLFEAYWENGTLVARIALVNTTGATQSGIYLKDLVIRGTNGQTICDAGFTTQGQNFTIQNNQCIVHTYRISGAAAPNQGTDIDTVSVSAYVAKI